MKGPKQLHLALSLAEALTAVTIMVALTFSVLYYDSVLKNVKLEQEKLSLNEQKIVRLKELAKNLSELSDKSKLIGNSLPTQKETSRLVSQIESLFCADNVRANACIVKSINFGQQSSLTGAVALKDPSLSQSYAAGDLALFPIVVSVETSYLNFYQKLKDLENFSRFLHIDNIQIQKSGAKVNINFDMYTYYQPDKINVPVEPIKKPGTEE